MECKFCDSYTGICMNPKSPMRGDDCPVPDTEDLCKYEVREEEIWKLSPKGCASAALMKANLIDSTSDPAIDVFWEDFSRLMERCGYVKEEDRDGKCEKVRDAQTGKEAGIRAMAAQEERSLR